MVDSYVRAKKRKIHAGVVVATADFHDARLRDNSERYIVALSFNEKRNQLAESRTRAPHRLFLLLERNLNDDPKLNAAMYCALLEHGVGTSGILFCIVYRQAWSVLLCLYMCHFRPIHVLIFTIVSNLYETTNQSRIPYVSHLFSNAQYQRSTRELSIASHALQTFELDNEDSSSFRIAVCRQVTY